MQGKFYAPVNLMELEDTLREHAPYATLIVSTTGLDDSTFVEHSPTRVVLTQYEYDEQSKSYKEGFAFDKLVQAPQAAIDRAIANTEYDAFANGGIDRSAYLDGTDVLSIPEFQKEFARAITAINRDATLIVNNVSHAEHYLGKIQCADFLQVIREEGHLLDQTRLTSEYMQKNGIHGSATLESLRNAIMPMPTACTFLKDKAIAKDFKEKSKEDFLKTYPKITPRAYGVAERFTESQAKKIVGGDNRSKVIHDFVTTHGRQTGILESELHSRLLQQESDYLDSLSAKGKTEYQGKSMTEKIDTLKEMGAVNPDEIRKGNSAFHKLMDAVESGDNKGIVIFHVATTGFERGKQAPQVTGQPIQFAALAYSRGEDGKVDLTQRPQGKSFLIEAPSRAILMAEKEASKQGGYDTFKEAGIDLAAYKAGEGVFSQEQAIKTISEFFKKCPPEDFTYVVIGGSGKAYPDRSFSQTALQNLGNFPVCNAETIDFCQAIKDYTIWIQEAKAQGQDVQNVLFGDKQLSRFGVKELAEAVNVPAESIAACKQKCGFVAKSLAALENQQTLLRGEPEKEASTPSPTPTKSASSPASAKTVQEPELTASDMERIEREAQDVAFEEMLRESGELTEEFSYNAGRKNGKLYSDKEGDSVPVITGLGKIKVVGEQPIPHISEALKQPVQESKPAPTVMEQRRRERHGQTSFDKSKFSDDAKPDKRPEQTTSSYSRPVSVQNNDALLKAIQMQSEMTNKLLTAVTAKDDQISKLTDIVAKQQEQIAQLQGMNMQMQTMLMQTMTEHNAFLTQMAMGVEHAPVVGKGNMVDFLERQKEQIDTVRGQLPDGTAKKQLTSANQALTDAQRTLEQQHGRDKAS